MPVGDWDEVAMLDGAGKFRLVSNPSGELLVDDELELRTRWNEFRVLRIGQWRILCLGTLPRGSQSNRSAAGRNSVFAQGELRVYDTKTKGLVWAREIDGLGIPKVQPQTTCMLTAITNVARITTTTTRGSRTRSPGHRDSLH